MEEKKDLKKGVFKIALTVVYNNDGMTPDEIADGVFEAMTKVGKGLALLNVDSVEPSPTPEAEIARILDEVSKQSQESMTRKQTEDGVSFVAVENKATTKKTVKKTEKTKTTKTAKGKTKKA